MPCCLSHRVIQWDEPEPCLLKQQCPLPRVELGSCPQHRLQKQRAQVHPAAPLRAWGSRRASCDPLPHEEVPVMSAKHADTSEVKLGASWPPVWPGDSGLCQSGATSGCSSHQAGSTGKEATGKLGRAQKDKAGGLHRLAGGLGLRAGSQEEGLGQTRGLPSHMTALCWHSGDRNLPARWGCPHQGHCGRPTVLHPQGGPWRTGRCPGLLCPQRDAFLSEPAGHTGGEGRRGRLGLRGLDSAPGSTSITRLRRWLSRPRASEAQDKGGPLPTPLRTGPRPQVEMRSSLEKLLTLPLPGTKGREQERLSRTCRGSVPF